jgi:hypothetical protein
LAGSQNTSNGRGSKRMGKHMKHRVLRGDVLPVHIQLTENCAMALFLSSAPSYNATAHSSDTDAHIYSNVKCPSILFVARSSF